MPHLRAMHGEASLQGWPCQQGALVGGLHCHRTTSGTCGWAALVTGEDSLIQFPEQLEFAAARMEDAAWLL